MSPKFFVVERDVYGLQVPDHFRIGKLRRKIVGIGKQVRMDCGVCEYRILDDFGDADDFVRNSQIPQCHALATVSRKCLENLQHNISPE